MRKMMRAVAALLALCMLVLCGCQPGGATQPSTAAPAADTVYSVSVVDGSGAPVTAGVVVRFLLHGEQAAMQPVNASGVASKKLPTDAYTVELLFSDAEAAWHYETENLTLDGQKSSLEIRLYSAVRGEGELVYDSVGESTAYAVNVGHTYVKLDTARRSYFLFAPKVAGVYRISLSDSSAVVGYYGYTSYIQAKSLVNLTDGAIELAISKGMVGEGGMSIPLVIGVDGNGADSCILHVERIGEPPHTIEDEPWYVYEPTVELTKFTTPAGTIREFDITAPTDTYTLVYNEADKTYHLNSADGPQVLVQLGKPTTYLPALSEICTTASMAKYFYDEDGNFVKRENYTKCMQIYSCTKVPTEGDRAQSAGKEVYLDLATGLYPLTEDLYYIIRSHGEFAGWWNPTSPGYLFLDADGFALPGINNEIAWLSLCRYVEQ